jgi:hypothetical protein
VAEDEDEEDGINGGKWRCAICIIKTQLK